MPQKAVLSKTPLIDAAMCALSRGQVRTDAKELVYLYQTLEKSGDTPYAWEALFSLACLLKERPADEPVTAKILDALKDTESGAFETDTDQQISVARAAFALYEYTTDRSILKRLARWCRWLEADWDQIMKRRWIRIQPADLMSFLVQYYRITGLKAVLRICSRLRSAAMDWTTILHNFHQRNPLSLPEMKEEAVKLFSRDNYDEIDFQSAQYLSNHAEILADGMRYTAWAAAYSGNGQELTAGRKGWETLKKNHSAVCGGTTGNIFLGGRGTDRGIHAASTAAWTEAMIAQAQTGGEAWSMNELVRLVFNALSDCMNDPEHNPDGYVNTLSGNRTQSSFDPEGSTDRPLRTLIRVARAAAMTWQNAVAVTMNGIQLNYLIPGRYMILCDGQSVVLHADRDALHIRCKTPAEINLGIFYASGETAQIEIQNAEGAEKAAAPDGSDREGGRIIRISRIWNNLDTLTFHQGERIHTENAAHQGVFFIVRNRIMALNVKDGEYRYAVSGNPFIRNGQVFARVVRIARWPSRKGIPADIPVLPGRNGDEISAPLTPYAETPCRISVFPRIMSHE